MSHKNPDQCVKKNISQPVSWWDAFAKEAKASGISLSEWLGEAAKARLPANTRNKLITRPAAHRKKSLVK